ncbi:conserved hypothetical protein [Hyphomonas neptunium ATCC 15444]|uniref:Uncharacterized protein n=2 Tax=Hyphomonas TaxID=85 RepID=Q0C1G4_HYPNA|nr:conserved hypothetical protein [Hyphomonas neptunium ATCC 15444]
MKTPSTLRTLFQKGEPFLMHPRDLNRIGQADHAALERRIGEKLILVTANAIGFRKPVECGYIDPSLIIIPGLAAADSETFIQASIDLPEAQGDPMDVMVNHVLEMGVDRPPGLYPLPGEAR